MGDEQVNVSLTKPCQCGAPIAAAAEPEATVGLVCRDWVDQKREASKPLVVEPWDATEAAREAVAGERGLVPREKLLGTSERAKSVQ